MRQWLSAKESLVVVALFAFNPLVCKLSGVIMPTPYYTVAVIASFLLMHELLKNQPSPAPWPWASVMGWGAWIITPKDYSW